MNADICVIGGGIVGMTAAAKLIAQGKSVILIEAHRIGRQVTGHSTAKITSQHNLIYHRLIKEYGEEKAKIYADANQAAIKEIEALIDQHSLSCEFEPKDAYIYAVSREKTNQLQQETYAATSLGLPASFVQEAPLPFPVAGAIKFSNQAQFNPCKYLLGLADSLEQKGCHIYEKTRATEVEHGQPCRIYTDKGVITVQDVVMATHLPLNKTGMFFSKAYAYMHPMIAAPVNASHIPQGMFISAEAPTHSVRAAKGQGGSSWLVAVGNSFKAGHTHEEKESFDDLIGFVRENFGVTDILYKWTNEDYNAMDGMPFIGRASKHHDHLYIATGFNAWGITTGTVAGMIIADQIGGRENPWAEIFDAARIPMKGSKSFAKENWEIGKHLVKGYLKDRPTTLAEVKSGEAQIIEFEDEKIGVFRQEDGTVHAVSAICSHMGCVLGWNETESTWDCHCHGSRFSCEGAVLHGPATKDLEKKHLPDLPPAGKTGPHKEAGR